MTIENKMKRLLLRSNIPLIFILQLSKIISNDLFDNGENKCQYEFKKYLEFQLCNYTYSHKFERLVPLATLVDETPFHFQFPFRPTRSNPGIIHGRRYFPRLILIKERNGRVHSSSRYENRYYSSGSPLPMALCTCGFMVLQRRDWLVCGQAPLYNDGSMVNNPT